MCLIPFSRSQKGEVRILTSDDVYKPKTTIVALDGDAGNTCERDPRRTALSGVSPSSPPAAYVTKPPPGAPGRSVRHRILPLLASNAYACLSMSAANTRPPFVGVIPDNTGAGALKRHLTCLPSASVAVTHPAQSRSRLPNWAASSVPVHVWPGFFASSGGSSVTVTHHSTVPL